MQQSTKTLNKDDILTTPARRAFFNSLMSGAGLLEAGKAAGISYDYAKDLNTKYHVAELVKKEQAVLEQKARKSLEINLKSQLRKLEELREICRLEKRRREELSCISEENRLAGLYEADNRQRGDRLGLVEAIKLMQSRLVLPAVEGQIVPKPALEAKSEDSRAA